MVIMEKKKIKTMMKKKTKERRRRDEINRPVFVTVCSQR